MGQHSEAELNCKFIETAKLMNIYLNHFPKLHKEDYDALPADPVL